MTVTHNCLWPGLTQDSQIWSETAFLFLYLSFKWNIPEPDQHLIYVEPDAGELQPTESSVRERIQIYAIYPEGTSNWLRDLVMLQIQIWSFSPLEEKAYTFKPTLTFWPIHTPGSNVSHLTLTVVGMGSKGFLKVRLHSPHCAGVMYRLYRHWMTWTLFYLSSV